MEYTMAGQLLKARSGIIDSAHLPPAFFRIEE
jgi:hypothetical protein